MDTLLKEFKSRMHIFHNSEDDNLKRILNSSGESIKRVTGATDIDTPELEELVLERSRYAYNDSLEYFEDNFLSSLLGVSFAVNHVEEGKE